MSSRNHLLQEIGSEITCDDLIYNEYLIKQSWYNFIPNRQKILPPNEKNPTKIGTWTYESPKHLETSKIYSPSELDKLRDHIMFLLEKASINNMITREMMGIEPQTRTGSILLIETHESI